MINRKNNRGFSLLELMVVIALIGVVIPVVYNIYLFSISSFSAQSSVVEYQTNLRGAMTYITKDIRMAETVENPSNPSEEEIFANSLRLKGFNNSPQETVEYILTTNKELQRNNKTLVDEIEFFQISRTSNGRITITIRSSSEGMRSGNPIELKSEIFIRE